MEKYKKIIKSMMGEDRYNHSISVAEYAVKLAKKYGADFKKANIVGLLHDITKEMSDNEQLKLFKENAIILSDLQMNTKKLWHSLSGSIYVKTKLGIYDEEIINAIKYHTTARANMTLLEKIIFIADFISDDRKWEDAEYLRKLAFEDLDKAVIYGLGCCTIPGLIEKESLIAEDTFKAYNYMIFETKF